MDKAGFVSSTKLYCLVTGVLEGKQDVQLGSQPSQTRLKLVTGFTRERVLTD